MNDSELMRLVELKTEAKAAMRAWQDSFHFAKDEAMAMWVKADMAEARYRLEVDRLARSVEV
jgi:hypothetical protein